MDAYRTSKKEQGRGLFQVTPRQPATQKPTDRVPIQHFHRSPFGAHKVIFLTDVHGWLRDPGDPESVISEASADEVEQTLDSIAGGMRPKLQACVEAIHGGVGYAHIIDGRVPHSLLLELFTDAGIGTKVRPAR